MHEEASILINPMLWYGAAVLLVALGLYFFTRKPFGAFLDAEIDKIRQELDQAKKLRLEAEAALAEFRARQEAAEREAEGIVAKARADAEQLRTEAEADLVRALRHQEEKALSRIEQAETEALSEVRRVVLERAMAKAEETLSRLDASQADHLIDKAIDELPSLSLKIKSA